MNPFLINISECFPKIITLYDVFYLPLFALLTMLGEKCGKLLFNAVSIVIRVVTKVDGVSLPAFLAETVLVPHLSPALVNCPKLGSAVGAVFSPRLRVRPLA
jgi:hypothetical protein